MSVHEIYWGVLSETTLVKKWIKEVGFVRERNEMVLKLQLRVSLYESSVPIFGKYWKCDGSSDLS